MKAKLFGMIRFLKKEILEHLQRCLAKYYCWGLLVGQIRRMQVESDLVS